MLFSPEMVIREYFMKEILECGEMGCSVYLLSYALFIYRSVTKGEKSWPLFEA